jgi:hypothetical protein
MARRTQDRGEAGDVIEAVRGEVAVVDEEQIHGKGGKGSGNSGKTKRGVAAG